MGDPTMIDPLHQVVGYDTSLNKNINDHLERLPLALREGVEGTEVKLSFLDLQL